MTMLRTTFSPRHLFVSFAERLFRHLLPLLTAWRIDNQPQITEAIRTVLKDDYNFDSTVCSCVLISYHHQCWQGSSRQNTFYALYRSFTECVFIEDEGSIVFYKNAEGEASRHIAEGVEVSATTKEKTWRPQPHSHMDFHWYVYEHMKLVILNS